MFFDRITYKAMGKARFQASYWKSVVAGLVFAFATGTLTTGRVNYTQIRDMGEVNVSELRETLSELFRNFRFPAFQETAAAGPDLAHLLRDSTAFLTFFAIFFALIAFAVVIATIFQAFVLGPLQVGASSYFYKNIYEDAALNELGCGFGAVRYFPAVKVMFLKGLFTWLWGLLFVIPGIIKRYEYYFIPYLAAAHPEMDTHTLFAASRAMTDGRKMDLFIMDLSFLGWDILGGLTFGLVNIFWTVPYKQSARGACYCSIAREIGL